MSNLKNSKIRDNFTEQVPQLNPFRLDCFVASHNDDTTSFEVKYKADTNDMPQGYYFLKETVVLLPPVKFENFFAEDKVVFGLGAVGKRSGHGGFGVVVFVHCGASVV